MDAFFASVEQHAQPELRGKPVVVGSPPDQRGVISAASYEARAFGIFSAMPSRTAFQRCPEAVFLPVNMTLYKKVSRQIMRIFESYTPLVQPLSIDEAFLDVTGSQRLFGTGQQIAEKIRRDIREATGLTASVGIAPNMFLAKLASDINKPDGITSIPFDQTSIEELLKPLPIKRLWGAGKVTQQKLLSHGITTFDTLQQCPIEQLKNIVGSHTASTFYQLARGIDTRGITLHAPEKSISNEHTFKKDTFDRNQIEKKYLRLIDKVASRIRAAEKYATTIHLKMRWDDFSTITRQRKLRRPCCDDITLREEGMALLNANFQNRPIRLIGFGLSGLTDQVSNDGGQLSLFEPPNQTRYEKRNRLSHVTDKIRKKYGPESIHRGSDVQSINLED